mgnify:CR=1 FL=1
MKNDKRIKKYEEAEKYYILGMSIPEIARKFLVKEKTVKTWIKRHDWKRTEIIINGMNLYEVREELLLQLERIGKKNIQNIIEIESYIDTVKDYYEYKKDLETRGYMIEWENGSQSGVKKNESAELKIKMANERRKILEFLGLNDIVTIKEDEDDDDL